jgi:ferritin
VGSWLTERRLSQTASRLRARREELRMIDEQIAQFADDAAELAVRALVSETPAASHESNSARKHLEAMQRHRQHVVAEIAGLEARQDHLLDQLPR